MTLNRYLSNKAAIALFWRLGERIADLTADDIEPTFAQISLFNRLAVIRRRLVDAFDIDYRNRPARLDW